MSLCYDRELSAKLLGGGREFDASVKKGKENRDARELAFLGNHPDTDNIVVYIIFKITSEFRRRT